MVKQERAVRTREALIKSAAEVFNRQGFTVASLTSISSQAGVSNGALHFHFASKGALAGAVEDAAVKRLGRITKEGAERPAGALQLLVDATHGLVRGLSDDIVLRAGFELSGETARPAKKDLRRHWQEQVGEMVERAGGAGELDETVDHRNVVTAVVAATVGLEVLGSRDPAWLSRRTLTQFWELLLPRLASAPVLGEIAAEGSGSARR